MAMSAVWAKFEQWLAVNWPEGLDDLAPPATQEDIDRLEAALGVALPADLVECLRVHNGQKGEAGGLIDGTEWLSTEAILGQWQIWKELLDGGEFEGTTSDPDVGVRNDWWNPRWIPLTYNGSGDHYCADLDPAPGGTPGQIITMWHDAGERNLQAASFAEWFGRYVDDVLEGKYAYSDEYGGLIDVDDL